MYILYKYQLIFLYCFLYRSIGINPFTYFHSMMNLINNYRLHKERLRVFLILILAQKAINALTE